MNKAKLIPTKPNTSETEIRAGIPDVFPRLWRYGLSLTGRRDWAEDLAQQTCLRALEKASNFQVGTHLDRWMFRMMHNLWINELRSKKVRTGAGLVAVEDTPLEDTRPDTESNIFANQVLTAVNGLPEAQRACVMLAYVEGYSYQECASILDVPIGTIMSRLAAARSKLAPLKQLEKAKQG
ncbi:MAG: RNA polymerase sigma factor [Aliishimia sp.]